MPVNLEIVAGIRFLVLDVDGVMTDGSIIYSASGDDLKVFDVKDGAGLKYWSRAGHRAGIISGRESETVRRRAAELGVRFVEMNAKTKLPVLLSMLEQAGVSLAETAMIGDDLLDLPLIRKVALGIAVADAVDEVKEAADLVTGRPGGHGAVREAIEFILKAQGRWDGILRRYLDSES